MKGGPCCAPAPHPSPFTLHGFSVSELTLVVPGLFGPFPSGSETLFRFPFLETLLARADRVGTAESPEQLLFDLFGIPVPPERDLPVAPLTRWSEIGERPDGFWLRADPVHLTADQDRLYLAAADDWPVSVEEGRRLAAELNPLLADEGMRLEIGTGSHWYLSLDRPARLRTRAPADCLGRDIHDCLPRGEEAARWRARQSELEMLLYASPVNAERMERGVPAINALWLWGGGELPAAPERAPFDRVCGDAPLVQGLARLTDTPFTPDSFSGDQLVGEGRLLVVWSGLSPAAKSNDPARFAHSVERLTEAVLHPVVDRLRHGSLHTLRLAGAPGPVLKLTAGNYRRFWRRRRPLTGWLDLG